MQKSQTKFSKQRNVINHLSSGKSLTAARAKSKFGVKNLRACISSIRAKVETYGNWEITTDGNGAYSMYDTHPGRRTYTFNRDGTRTMIA